MAVHLFLAGLGFLAPIQMHRALRDGWLTRKQAVILGILSGGTCGAGMLLGLRFQNTTANIHSGYSLAGIVEWFVLAFIGGPRRRAG